MKNTQSKNKPHVIWEFLSSVWEFLSSVKLTIVLLILLAIVSIVGTVIPQGQGAVEFAKNLHPAMFRFFKTLQLFDMYNAPWFRLLIAFLALNLVVCSINRFPSTWKRFSTKPAPDRSKPFENSTPEDCFEAGVNVDKASTRVEKILKSGYKNVHQKTSGANHFFYGDKGSLSYFGVYVVHLSVLLILVGGLMGSFFGFEAYVNILEGETTDQVIIRKTMRPLDLGFEVRCDKFSVDFYESGAPKEFKSNLTFMVNGKAVRKNDLLVNHPVEFGGVTFYQASYGSVADKEARLRIDRKSNKPVSSEKTVKGNISYPLPGGEGTYQVVDMRNDIMHLGPAVLILLKPKTGEPIEFWVFKNYDAVQKKLPPPMLASPKFNPEAFSPYRFSLTGLKTVYYTGLQANRDPGVPIVWAGCFLMVSGLFVTFFMSHKKMWVRVLGQGTGAKIEVAGTTNKNPVGLQKELRQLVTNIQNEFHKKG
ncbi:MAG: cytochrome c biogenesis protein ResB [Deltaproteobacteria bacterium]|nr:cytochrome c biogenesis protein ResB [Deltaproteobacteria bacterium]